MSLSQSEQKILAARTAVETLVKKGLIFSGMKIGLIESKKWRNKK